MITVFFLLLPRIVKRVIALGWPVLWRTRLMEERRSIVEQPQKSVSFGNGNGKGETTCSKDKESDLEVLSKGKCPRKDNAPDTQSKIKKAIPIVKCSKADISESTEKFTPKVKIPKKGILITRCKEASDISGLSTSTGDATQAKKTKKRVTFSLPEGSGNCHTDGVLSRQHANRKKLRRALMAIARSTPNLPDAYKPTCIPRSACFAPNTPQLTPGSQTTPPGLQSLTPHTEFTPPVTPPSQSPSTPSSSKRHSKHAMADDPSPDTSPVSVIDILCSPELQEAVRMRIKGCEPEVLKAKKEKRKKKSRNLFKVITKRFTQCTRGMKE